MSWVLPHMRDLDADFLAMYGIDLDRDGIDGPRFFALAHRLPAYQGVMAARVEAQRDKTRPGPGPGSRTEQRPAGGTVDDGREVSLTAFRVQFPGLVSMGTG